MSGTGNKMIKKPVAEMFVCVCGGFFYILFKIKSCLSPDLNRGAAFSLMSAGGTVSGTVAVFFAGIFCMFSVNLVIIFYLELIEPSL